MSAIYDRLIHLNERLKLLEQAVDTPAKKIQDLQTKIQQDGKKRTSRKNEPDLFSMGNAAANKNAAVGPLSYDPKLAARKIDNAIDRIEQMLKEG